jgi:hypothetical protein
MNVLFLSPGYPDEMSHYVRGLADVGARVFGVGDHPQESLPEETRAALTAYVQVPGIMDEGAVMDRVLSEIGRHGVNIDRVETLWEPLMLLGARLRERMGVQGMTVEQTVPFRDKEIMKQVLDRAGIRTPRHARCRTTDEIWAAAEMVGFPLIVKPIDGAGSADTHRVDEADQLAHVVQLVTHVPEVSVEEFIDGEEFTFDTICSNGRVHHYNMGWYRPRPLVARTVEWMDSQTIALRDVDDPFVADGRKMGFEVLEALGFETGFTHMEWFRKPDGEVVFGEIGARPPGARMSNIINFAADFDCYRGWAEAVCYGNFSQPVARRYNSAMVFKRARGQGQIREIRGMERWMRRYGEHVVHVEMLPVGAQRRNWKATLLSDGHVMVRHPDLQATLAICDAFGTDVTILAS